MKLLRRLYLNFSKKRFTKSFKPIGVKKRANYLVSPPANLKDFLKVLPLMGGLHTLGQIVLLVPKNFENIFKILKANLFEVIYYEKMPMLLTKEFKSLRKHLNKRDFYSLIEFNVPANISLPYLVAAEKRISFYDKNNFPYYNILIKGDISILHNFFQIEKEDPLNLFKFHSSDLKKIERELPKHRPLLFVNGEDNTGWNGDKVVLGKDALPRVNTYKILYLCDAYYGKDDELSELAKLFNKEIIN